MSAVDPGAGLVARWPQLRAAYRRLAGEADDGPLSRAEIETITGGIGELSQGLTRERALVGARYLAEPSLLGAYLLFFWPISYAQARAVLGELPRSHGRVLDLGAGPMPMSWAAIDAGASSVLALDRVDRALSLGKALGEAAVESLVWDPERSDSLPEGKFDTIIAGHVVNELFLNRDRLDRRVSLLARALERLSPSGRLIIIEPALRETSRALLQLRDRLVETGAEVHAPCVMRAPCPALVRESDWCHAERDWTAPEEFVALAERARLHKERIKFSYLVLSPVGDARNEDPALFRIVSEPLVSKGKRAYFGCGTQGRHPIVRRDRDATAANAGFDALQRGDLVRAERLLQKGDGLRLDPDSPFGRVAAAGDPPGDG